MKKIIGLLLSLILVLALFAGCGNKDFLDTEYTFDYAIVQMPDGTIQRIEIESWTDYEDGDQLQIKATDGTVYLVHSVNTVFVKEHRK